MKKNKFVPILVFLTTISGFVYAQRLPQKQLSSVFAPENIKIDGRTSEWNGIFEAYQRVNRMFYTVSNDNSNLYLTIFVKDSRAVSKILNGGLTFAIDFPPKNSKDFSITYPAVPNRRSNSLDRLANSPRVYRILMEDSIANKMKIDSLSFSSNSQIKEWFKEIQVDGIKEQTEPLISVYNLLGIQVAAVLNRNMEYTYELAIPLKYINAINPSGKFRYNIRLNRFGTVLVPGPQLFDPPNIFLQDRNMEDDFSNNPTDFWNEYTIITR